MSRRRLPAPPLVLRPIFIRVSENTTGAHELLRLADYLRSHSMLTGGGESKLELGLSGPGRKCSLTLQDVRSWSHGLVEQLVLSISHPERWAALQEQYLQTYDRGKPRRPTHLQRLYQRWSSDLNWTGLIVAAHRHPRIWPDIEHAIGFLEDPSSEKHLLNSALQMTKSKGFQTWENLYDSNPAHRYDYLRLLPLVGTSTLAERVNWLEETLAKDSMKEELQVPAVFCALRRRGDPVFEGSCPHLFEQNLRLIARQAHHVNPLLLYALLTTLNRPDFVPDLWDLVRSDDPVLKIGYGARPGISWVKELWKRLGTKLSN